MAREIGSDCPSTPDLTSSRYRPGRIGKRAVNIWVEPDLHARICAAARAAGVSQERFVIEAIERAIGGNDG